MRVTRKRARAVFWGEIYVLVQRIHETSHPISRTLLSIPPTLLGIPPTLLGILETGVSGGVIVRLIRVTLLPVTKTWMPGTRSKVRGNQGNGALGGLVEYSGNDIRGGTGLSQACAGVVQQGLAGRDAKECHH